MEDSRGNVRTDAVALRGVPMKLVVNLLIPVMFLIAAALIAPASNAVAQQPPAVGNGVITSGPDDLGNGNYGWSIKTSDGTDKYVVTNRRGGIRRYTTPQAYFPPPAPPPVYERNVVEPGYLPAETYGIHTPGVPPIATHQPGWVPQKTHGNNVPVVKQDQPGAKLDHPADNHNGAYFLGVGSGFGLAGFGIYEIVHPPAGK
jgi:hypothetical protein